MSQCERCYRDQINCKCTEEEKLFSKLLTLRCDLSSLEEKVKTTYPDAAVLIGIAWSALHRANDNIRKNMKTVEIDPDDKSLDSAERSGIPVE